MARRTRGTPLAVARWLARCPADADARVELRTQGLTEASVIAQWPGRARDAAESSAADMVDAAQDDCDGRGTSTEYRLVWVDAEQRDVASYPLRLTADEPASIEGASIEGVVAQMMRHQEAMARLYVSGQERLLTQMGETLSLVSKRLAHAERQRSEVEELRAEVMAAQSAVVEADADAEARRARDAKLMTYIDMAIQQGIFPRLLKAGGGGADG